MKIYMNPEVYECDKAEQHSDGVHLLHEDGSILVIIASINDIDAVEDGQIVIVDSPTPTKLDRIESQVAYLAMMTGNEDILEV